MEKSTFLQKKNTFYHKFELLIYSLFLHMFIFFYIFLSYPKIYMDSNTCRSEFYAKWSKAKKIFSEN